MIDPVFLLCYVFFSVVLAHCKPDSQPLPRPLILEYPNKEAIEERQEVDLRCTSWRVAVEANNLSPWKTIPLECAEYVKDYMTGRGYSWDSELVAEEAGVYARSVELSGDGKDVWIFDVDETLLSNLPYYAERGFGLELFDKHEFDKWVDKAVAPAIESSRKLYEQIQNLGFKVFLLTGRSENHRSITEVNLLNAGFQNWDKLILRGVDDHGKPATIYKSEKREEMVKEGYRILGNSGDQWSDLLGSSISNRSFKLPNPMYYIP
ncbi:acid phosphatase 1-like [Aristolochia californica]|uniref:acid phosphatase 1-like n=1 Tax=Aristolochia californica TaxID=171875 RepID=UPI0035D9CDFD